ncbi:MAG: energy-coupling factor transporter transmembrane component T [Syntrophaceticus schinkii]|jgi:energy-coupling factor transport system permease protein
MSRFESFHPLVIFLYYVIVLFVTMFTNHPIVLLCALTGGIAFSGTLSTGRQLLSDIGFYLLLFILLSLANPLFTHNGETVLFFMNDNPVTKEAFVYGEFIAIMIIAVIFWSKCLNQVMTTDKVLFLFGRVVPKLSLILAMALRFIPLFKRQAIIINNSQKTMGLYAADNIPDKVKGTVRVFDSLIGWSIENSLETADSMKARGYGLPERSAFSIFSMHRSDLMMFGLMASFLLLFFTGKHAGLLIFQYYPTLGQIYYSGWSVGLYALTALFMFFPSIIEIMEKIKWKYLESKI